MLKIVCEDKARQYIKDIEDWTISQGGVWKGFKLTKVEFDWSPHRVTSRGGMYSSGPGINIAMQRYGSSYSSVKAYRVHEYKSFDKDPDIGGFFTDNKMDGLKMILCHEIAHASQFYLYKVNYFRHTPHGETFKTIYRKIRKQFLNSTLPDQEPLREEFCKQATDFTKLAMSEL